MLKDLDQRQEGTRDQVSANLANPQSQTASKRYFGIAIVIIVLLNVAAWFVWQMYQENQSLKKQKNSLLSESKQEVAQNAPSNTSTTPKQLIEKVEEATSLPVTPSTFKSETVELANATADKKVDAPLDTVEQKPVAKKTISALEEKVVENNETKVSSSDDNVTKRPIDDDIVKPTISIKRRQLSAEELAQKNYKQAQQALNAGDVKSAEKWFEEVLLLTPDHAQARKELAALWFGKQDFSAAHNLLSQGLSREHNNSDFRLMKARIFIKQGRLEQAMLTLAAMKDFADVEYQSLLASTAQQIEAYEQAIYAYQQLTLLEANNGKWWLGLAIGLDKKSQFKQAVDAYTRAVGGHSLSINATEFAQSRIRALGE